MNKLVFLSFLLISFSAISGNEGGGQSGNGNNGTSVIPGLEETQGRNPGLPPSVLRRPGPKSNCRYFLELLETSESFSSENELEIHCRNLLNR